MIRTLTRATFSRMKEPVVVETESPRPPKTPFPQRTPHYDVLEAIRAGEPVKATIHKALESEDHCVISKDFRLFYGDAQALFDISMTVPRGKVTALIGPSGCGKTTMLRHTLGLETATSGEVTLGGQQADEARRARDLGYVFQKAALVPSITALENVQMTLNITRVSHGLDPHQLLEDFGLGQFKDHHPHKLSGGMQQRVNIATALVHNPHYLLMDEPFGALDEMTKETMAEWLGKVLLKNPKTVILVTHSIEEAVMLADRIVILEARPGQINTIVPVDLPRPRTRDIKTTDAFGDLVLEVRRKLYAVEEKEKAA